ncbi:hypothetical protein N7533_008571 [Penicillium manginii]|uniref:uncharacterized protein n=1 Tax=Penicillium manginii TaxID=203109 RepID=UPI002548ABB4|nr:uncharacterized protein N7533_008571 [Penicillium manginii]KAJ5743701.1 hypothetical protein N7533_008571 [Penicillium manginii]
MDWHNTDFGLKEQFHDLSGTEEIPMNLNLSSAPESDELGDLFRDLPFFPPSQELNPISQYHTGLNTLSTSSTLGNVASGFQCPSQGNQTEYVQRPDNNHGGLSEISTATHPLLCIWPGCTRPGPFSLIKSLKRHIHTQHVAPRSFKCPHDGCTMYFNRKDNLDQHLRSNTHGKKT